MCRYTGREDYEFGDITKATLRRVGSAVEWVADKAERALSTDSNATSSNATSSSKERGGRKHVQRPYPAQSQQSPHRDTTYRSRRRSLIDEHLGSRPAQTSMQPSAPAEEDEGNTTATAPTLQELSFPEDNDSGLIVPDLSLVVTRATETIDIELVCSDFCIDGNKLTTLILTA